MPVVALMAAALLGMTTSCSSTPPATISVDQYVAASPTSSDSIGQSLDPTASDSETTTTSASSSQSSSAAKRRAPTSSAAGTTTRATTRHKAANLFAGKRELRVLFVGNSFTGYNDLPAMVQRISEATAGAKHITAQEYSPGDRHLAQTVQDAELMQRIRSQRFDAVVLQEYSNDLAKPHSQWQQQSEPAFRTLANATRAAGGVPVLYMTWGYRNGDEEQSGDSYAAMQNRITAAYRELGRRLSAPVAPVGVAWQAMRTAQPQVDLYGEDIKHPSLNGTYVAACTIFETLTGADVRTTTYTAGASAARSIQEQAHRAVAANR